jgi:hypothetical protein
VEKGKIVAKKAYADWSRFGGYAGSLHESAIELIEIPKRSMTGKNSADIRLVVDAVDLAYSKDHIDTFVIVSGDSDFSPLVSKLKELGKHVIGLGLVEATSNLLRDNCDEFIYYEDLDRPAALPMTDLPQLPEEKRKVFGLLVESLLALRRENKETIFSSMAKDTMKRKRPSFNEEYHGYRTFSELLEDAARHGLIEIEKHKSSGTYVVTKFGGELRLPGGPGGPPNQLPHPQPMALPHRGGGQLPAEPPRDVRPPRAEQRPASPPQRIEPPARVPQQPTVPVRPAAPPPTQPPRQQVKPSPPPPARTPVVEDDERLPLGRSLIDDIDDDDDELPSYGPQKKPAAAEPKQPVRATAKPSRTTEPKPAKKPQATPAPAEKPKAKPKAGAKPAAAAAAEPPARQTRSPGGRANTKPAAPEPKPVPAKKPAAKPKAEEEDSFGAGLDD